MSPPSVTCPRCNRTLHHKGALHACRYYDPLDEKDAEAMFASEARASRLIALAVLAFGVGALLGWWIWTGVRK